MAKKPMSFEQCLELGLNPQLARRVADGAKLTIPELEDLQIKLNRRILILREKNAAEAHRRKDIEAQIQELQVPKDKPV